MSPPLAVTEDTPADMLTGSMDLDVVLPSGQLIRTSVLRSTPMMDLLIQITTARRMNPGNFSLQAMGERGILPYQPSTPIGLLDAFTVRIAEKKSTNLKRAPPVPVAMPNTFRLQVHLPRSQLFVTRVSPEVTVGEILSHVCKEKCLDVEKYELRNTANLSQSLELQATLAQCQSQQLTLVVKGSHPTRQLSSADIIHVKQSNHREKSVCDSSLSSGSLDSRSISPVTMSAPPQVPQRKKRRPAPKPPTSESQPRPVISHSRESSDSSGYHEPSTLSESPTHGGPPGLVVRSNHSQSLSNLTSLPQGRLCSSDSVTSLSSNVSGQSRKKRAPPPPVQTCTPAVADIKVKSSTLPKDTRPNSDTAKAPDPPLPPVALEPSPTTSPAECKENKIGWKLKSKRNNVFKNKMGKIPIPIRKSKSTPHASLSDERNGQENSKKTLVLSHSLHNLLKNFRANFPVKKKHRFVDDTNKTNCSSEKQQRNKQSVKTDMNKTLVPFQGVQLIPPLALDRSRPRIEPLRSTGTPMKRRYRTRSPDILRLLGLLNSEERSDEIGQSSGQRDECHTELSSSQSRHPSPYPPSNLLSENSSKIETIKQCIKLGDDINRSDNMLEVHEYLEESEFTQGDDVSFCGNEVDVGCSMDQQQMNTLFSKDRHVNANEPRNNHHHEASNAIEESQSQDNLSSGSIPNTVGKSFHAENLPELKLLMNDNDAKVSNVESTGNEEILHKALDGTFLSSQGAGTSDKVMHTFDGVKRKGEIVIDQGSDDNQKLLPDESIQPRTISSDNLVEIVVKENKVRITVPTQANNEKEIRRRAGSLEKDAIVQEGTVLRKPGVLCDCYEARVESPTNVDPKDNDDDSTTKEQSSTDPIVTNHTLSSTDEKLTVERAEKISDVPQHNNTLKESNAHKSYKPAVSWSVPYRRMASNVKRKGANRPNKATTKGASMNAGAETINTEEWSDDEKITAELSFEDEHEKCKTMNRNDEIALESEKCNNVLVNNYNYFDDYSITRKFESSFSRLEGNSCNSSTRKPIEANLERYKKENNSIDKHKKGELRTKTMWYTPPESIYNADMDSVLAMKQTVDDLVIFFNNQGKTVPPKVNRTPSCHELSDYQEASDKLTDTINVPDDEQQNIDLEITSPMESLKFTAAPLAHTTNIEQEALTSSEESLVINDNLKCISGGTNVPGREESMLERQDGTFNANMLPTANSAESTESTVLSSLEVNEYWTPFSKLMQCLANRFELPTCNVADREPPSVLENLTEETGKCRRRLSSVYTASNAIAAPSHLKPNVLNNVDIPAAISFLTPIGKLAMNLTSELGKHDHNVKGYRDCTKLRHVLLKAVSHEGNINKSSDNDDASVISEISKTENRAEAVCSQSQTMEVATSTETTNKCVSLCSETQDSVEPEVVDSESSKIIKKDLLDTDAAQLTCENSIDQTFNDELPQLERATSIITACTSDTYFELEESPSDVLETTTITEASMPRIRGDTATSKTHKEEIFMNDLQGKIDDKKGNNNIYGEVPLHASSPTNAIEILQTHCLCQNRQIERPSIDQCVPETILGKKEEMLEGCEPLFPPPFPYNILTQRSNKINLSDGDVRDKSTDGLLAPSTSIDNCEKISIPAATSQTSGSEIRLFQLNTDASQRNSVIPTKKNSMILNQNRPIKETSCDAVDLALSLSTQPLTVWSQSDDSPPLLSSSVILPGEKIEAHVSSGNGELFNDATNMADNEVNDATTIPPSPQGVLSALAEYLWNLMGYRNNRSKELSTSGGRTCTKTKDTTKLCGDENSHNRNILRRENSYVRSSVVSNLVEKSVSENWDSNCSSSAFGTGSIPVVTALKSSLTEYNGDSLLDSHHAPADAFDEGNERTQEAVKFKPEITSVNSESDKAGATYVADSECSNPEECTVPDVCSLNYEKLSCLNHTLCGNTGAIPKRTKAKAIDETSGWSDDHGEIIGSSKENGKIDVLNSQSVRAGVLDAENEHLYSDNNFASVSEKKYGSSSAIHKRTKSPTIVGGEMSFTNQLLEEDVLIVGLRKMEENLKFRHGRRDAIVQLNEHNTIECKGEKEKSTDTNSQVAWCETNSNLDNTIFAATLVSTAAAQLNFEPAIQSNEIAIETPQSTLEASTDKSKITQPEDSTYDNCELTTNQRTTENDILESQQLPNYPNLKVKLAKLLNNIRGGSSQNNNNGRTGAFDTGSLIAFCVLYYFNIR